ncbi:MAG TPA: YbaK/EbsC family protein [Candidatus Pacearchaeota archaeon]|nr:YbaK/EbsC family protein [Candidatus Pacearchaeota archaeon]
MTKMKSKPNTKTGTGKKIKVPKKVEGFLAKVGAKYELVGHRTVYTAFDKAATLKIKPGTVAKVLTLKIGKELVLAAMGSDKNLDIEKLQKLAKTEKIAFAKEKAIVETFKGIDPGAIPPFAGLWNVKVFCDKKLLEAPKIILPSGSYEASLKITSGGLKKINPEIIIGNFSSSRPKKTKTAKSKVQNKSAGGVLKRKKK